MRRTGGGVRAPRTLPGALLLAALAAACQPSPPPVPALATTRERRVTMDDLDAYVLALPQARQRTVGKGDAALEALLREIVVEDALEKEARTRGLADAPEMKESLVEAERELLAEACLERLAPGGLQDIDDAEVARFFEEHRDRYRRPARRLVFSIFLRQPEGTPREEVRARIEELRRRILAGEPFKEIARASSDSETRLLGGLVGWLEQGSSPPDLDRVVFGLPVGAPSEPVGTKDGYHLFLVESASEAKEFSLDEMRRTVVQHLVGQRQEERIDRLTASTPEPEGAYVPTEAELRDLVAAGDGRSVVMRYGAYELPLSRLMALLADASSAGRGTGWLPWQTVRAIARRERLCHHCESAAVVPAAEVEERLAGRRREVLIRLARRERLRGWVAAHAAEVDEFFTRHEKRFMTPLRLHVRILTCKAGDCVPPGKAVAAMADLEAKSAALAAEGRTLDDLAVELHAVVEDLGLVTLAELRRRDPRAAAVALQITPGGLSAPVSRDGSLQVIELRERVEPRPQELAKVRSLVEAAYLEAHQQDVQAAVEEKILEEVGFELHPEELAKVGPPFHPARAAS